MLDLNLIANQLRPVMAPQTTPKTKTDQTEGIDSPAPLAGVAALFDQFNTGLGQIGSALTNIDVLDETGVVVALADIAAQVIQVTQELHEIKNAIELMGQIANRLNAGGLDKETLAALLEQLAKLQEIAAKFGIEVKVIKQTDAAGNASYDFVIARNNNHYNSADPQQMKAFLTDFTREFLRESIKREGSLQVKEQYLKKLQTHEDVKNDPDKQKAIDEMLKKIDEAEALGEANRDGFRSVAKASGYTDEQIDAMILQTEAEAMLALVKEIGQQKHIQATLQEAAPKVAPISTNHAPLLIMSDAPATYSEENLEASNAYRSEQQQARQKQEADELDYLLGVYAQQRLQEQKQQNKQEEQRYLADKQQEQDYILRALGQP